MVVAAVPLREEPAETTPRLGAGVDHQDGVPGPCAIRDRGVGQGHAWVRVRTGQVEYDRRSQERAAEEAYGHSQAIQGTNHIGQCQRTDYPEGIVHQGGCYEPQEKSLPFASYQGARQQGQGAVRSIIDLQKRRNHAVVRGQQLSAAGAGRPLAHFPRRGIWHERMAAL